MSVPMGSMQELVGYVRRNLKKGYTQSSLKVALLNQGYSRLEVEKAFRRVDQELASEVPLLKEKPVIRHSVIDEVGNEFAVNPERQGFIRRVIGFFF